VKGDVTFTDAGPDTHGAIDAAYHAKYDRYGPRIVGTVVGPHAAVTLRLLPRAAGTDESSQCSSRSAAASRRSRG
jgi:hypothetical protein